MATFLANEINATERLERRNGPNRAQIQIMFPLKDKNIN